MEMKVIMETVDRAIHFVDIVSGFNENVDLVRGRYTIDAKSIMGVLSMDLTTPVTLRVNTSKQRFLEISSALEGYAA
jgi:phosphotransferase system HPr-like phosphotransfer protein